MPRVALITGAGGAIGRGLALAFARRGYAVAAVDCRQEGLVRLAEEIRDSPGRCAWAVADVTQADALRARVEELEQALGPTDLLIANAGVGFETAALNLKAEDVARIINVNLIGVANSVAAVLPGMLSRRRGHLAAVSSIASLLGMPGMLAYCASKAGVNGFMEGLRVEVRSLGLHVTTVCPGWVRTPMTAEMLDRLWDVMEPEVAVRHIVWAIDRKALVYTFPAKARWMLRVFRWLPLAWQDALSARIAARVRETGAGRP
jgi:short-subunit dehydrogenase